MGKEAMALECTNSLGSEKHIHLVPSLAASRSPVPPAALLWAGATVQDCPGVASKDQEALECLAERNDRSPAGSTDVNRSPGALKARARTVVY